MASVNKVILVGNLGRDPEVRFAPEGGGKVVTLSVATSEQWKDRDSGEYKERTEWHRVVVFNAHFCDVCEKFLKKGSRIYVEGQLHTRKWKDLEGTENKIKEIVIRYKGEITILDRPGGGPVDGVKDEKQPFAPPAASAQDVFDDEIPF
ncbi:single-stranded DNA-binding protein [Candidatus Hydrogenosomobacter endosymbioticus]|uniref:Single-stranded DNA-binding protein n=1 Tax=Candidatus Hydrogenosomobacter endosymbioticus TaxID=2558174 RepID=A0ABN6L2Y1_9PROT|nr:single-stranded DNA-binding protein [Candidatus Hydrogenosomobacter endosymbioticus]BDB96188.1 single-stranded DNA-binding protein [Candidatus Hydrogenosomobacter endosymbioticus]